MFIIRGAKDLRWLLDTHTQKYENELWEKV